jgi:hypothetical protein
MIILSNGSSLLVLKGTMALDVHGNNQVIRCGRLMGKARGLKSRATGPLNQFEGAGFNYG